MGGLDGTIVNIALPTISESFNVSTTMVSWVATAYLLVMAGCVLVFGKVSDIIGFKKVFLAGFGIFTLGSFACGVLPDLFGSLGWLIGSRIFQAIGGAMITAIASFETWDLQRFDLNRTPAQIKRAWRTTLRSMLETTSEPES